MPKFTNYHAPYEAEWRRFFFDAAKWDPNKPRTIVEIGSYEGSSAWWIMTHLLKSPESKLFCIDPWEGADGETRYQKFLQNLQEIEGHERIEVLRERSDKGLRELLNRGITVDVLYVDGGHDASTVLHDLVVGVQLVKRLGFIICDDYLWDDPRFGGDRLEGRPKMAIDAFTTIYCKQVRTVPGMQNRQTFIQKVK